METPSKQNAPAGAAARNTQRKPAPQISNWLAFIRPHADRYESQPRGERRKLIEKLTEKSVSSGNTLRRYIAAARMLERHGIRQFPARLRHLPVATVEAIERISRKDAARRRELFQELMGGLWTTHMLKDKLAETPRRARNARTADVERYSRERILDVIARHTSARREDLSPIRFADARLGRNPNLFAKTVVPRYIVPIAGGKRAAIFDEGVLACAAGLAMIVRKFLRHIAVATATFDCVVVACNTLMSDVEGIVAVRRIV